MAANAARLRSLDIEGDKIGDLRQEMSQKHVLKFNCRRKTLTQKMRIVAREIRSAIKRRRLRSTSLADAIDRVVSTKLVFVHVPKCGGKSIIKEVYDIEEHDYFGHAGISFYEEILGPRKFRSSFKFAFVRDPVLRCLSGFRFRQRGGFKLDGEDEISDRFKGISFEEFVLDGILAEVFYNDVVFKPQNSFLLLPSGNLGVDRICRFENFNNEVLNLPVRRNNHSVAHINAAPDRYTSPISPDAASTIMKIYRDDYCLMEELE